MNRHKPCLNCARVSVGAAMWALVLVTEACRHAPPVAPIITNEEPSSAKLDQRLSQISWFPADIRDLSYFRGDRSHMLQWLDNSPIPLPSCYRELRPTIDSHYMVTPLAGGGAVNVMHGQLDRDRMESCFSLAANALQLTVEVHRQGQLSEFITSKGGRHYAGWTGDGWLVYHADRARVEQFLQRTSALRERTELTTLRRAAQLRVRRATCKHFHRRFLGFDELEIGTDTLLIGEPGKTSGFCRQAGRGLRRCGRFDAMVELVVGSTQVRPSTQRLVA